MKVSDALSEPLTAYQVAKKLKVSWSTAKTRLLEALSRGEVDYSVTYKPAKKTLWRRK